MSRSILFTVVIISLTGACSSSGTAGSREELPISTPVKTENKIQLVQLTGETLNPIEGKILILNIWATWCKPCIQEMPDLEKMSKELPDNFELILASDEDLNRINSFVSAQSFNLTFARITSNLDSLNVYSLPTTLVLSPTGEILETLVGARDWESPEQINQILSLAQ